MVDVSQNGWPVHKTSDDLISFVAAGVTWKAPNSDVVTVARYVINRFAQEVEPIAGKPLDDWSWAYRPIRGQTSGFSNHASATAWDLNATKHPRGQHGTFTDHQVTVIRRILRDLGAMVSGVHVIRWGGDYVHAPIDSMHFEINVAPSVVAKVARIIRGKALS